MQKNADILAKELGYITDRLVLLLDALTSMELVEKKGTDYFALPISKIYLSKDSPFYLGDLIRRDYSSEQNQSWEMLLPWLKGEFGKNEYHDPAAVFQPSLIDIMAHSTLSNDNFQETVSLITRHPCFSSAQRTLDLGGGHALYSIVLKQIKPDLEAVVFDLPQVLEVSQKYADRYGAELAFYPGNFYEDELPPQQDIILAFNILHPVEPVQKEAVFKKIYHALNKGGHLFYKLCFLDDTRTSPRTASIFALKFKIKNQYSHVYTLNEAKAMLQRIGFQVENAILSKDRVSTVLIARK